MIFFCVVGIAYHRTNSSNVAGCFRSLVTGLFVTIGDIDNFYNAFMIGSISLSLSTSHETCENGTSFSTIAVLSLLPVPYPHRIPLVRFLRLYHVSLHEGTGHVPEPAVIALVSPQPYSCCFHSLSDRSLYPVMAVSGLSRKFADLDGYEPSVPGICFLCFHVGSKALPYRLFHSPTLPNVQILHKNE